MMKRKTKVYTIRGFLNNEEPVRVEGGLNNAHGLMLGMALGAAATFTMFSVIGVDTTPVFAATDAITSSTPQDSVSVMHPVSKVFDAKIFPLFIDIGKPLAKTMMALGIYKVMRNDDKGWKIVQRAGLGLVALYLINGGIHVLEGVGQNLESV